MGKNRRNLLFILGLIGTALAIGLFIKIGASTVLNPEGQIAERQKDLIVFASLLSLIVVLPVFVLTIFIATRYREGNKKARYEPDWDRNLALETTWWAIPTALIVILSVITWRTTHELDPFKPLASNTTPITIQVVALDWKWLFIYPEQGIATVNYFQFPENTPIDFQITADAPMNSFWIPALGGQIYAMSGMSTQLHLIANETGTYRGSSANISGAGFAGMKFTAQSTTNGEFTDWVRQIKATASPIGMADYTELSEPSRDEPEALYALKEPDLFNQVLAQFALTGSGGHAHDENEKGSLWDY